MNLIEKNAFYLNKNKISFTIMIMNVPLLKGSPKDFFK